MAVNGFYFDPTKTHMDRVGCFTCKVKEFGWSPGETDPPAVRHLRSSPDCVFSNILGARHQHETDHLSWDEHETFADLKESAQIRLKTFKLANWPHERNKKMPSSTELAENGFYYSAYEKGDDTTTCMYCGTSLEGWEEGDDVAAEHKKRTPDCYVFSGRRRTGVYSRRNSVVASNVIEISDTSIEQIQEKQETEVVEPEKTVTETKVDEQPLQIDLQEPESVEAPQVIPEVVPETQVEDILMDSDEPPRENPEPEHPQIDSVRLEEEVVDDDSLEAAADPVEIPMSTLNELEDLFFVEDSRRSSTFFNRSRPSTGGNASYVERQPIPSEPLKEVPEEIPEEAQEQPIASDQIVPDYAEPEMVVPDSQSFHMGLDESLREMKQIDPLNPVEEMDMLDESTRDDIKVKDTVDSQAEIQEEKVVETVNSPEKVVVPQEESAESTSKKRKRDGKVSKKHKKRRKEAKENEKKEAKEKEREKKRKRREKKHRKQRKHLKETSVGQIPDQDTLVASLPGARDSNIDMVERSVETKNYVEELVETDFSAAESEPEVDDKMESIEEQPEIEEEQEQEKPKEITKESISVADATQESAKQVVQDEDEDDVVLDKDLQSMIPQPSESHSVSPSNQNSKSDTRSHYRVFEGRVVSSDDPLSFGRKRGRRAKKIRDTTSSGSKEVSPETDKVGKSPVAREQPELIEKVTTTAIEKPATKDVALYEREIFNEKPEVYEDEAPQVMYRELSPEKSVAQTIASSPIRREPESQVEKENLPSPAKLEKSPAHGISFAAEQLSGNQSTPEVKRKSFQWEPIKQQSYSEELEEAIEYTKELLDCDYQSLNDDLEGKLTNFVAEMPEEELEMTIKQWINYQAEQASRAVLGKTEEMIKNFRVDSARALAALEALPVAEDNDEDVIF
ncbi:hypothetical protein OGAPHI_005287 [Ogataea philodendri]|uniref:Uncharacterized protein n=1 Tax=Ogataea philodendri TaxID=1378263 RepID=A0A9P8P379_9ASCO|nr:uncharacterized protein OGAPHI_005287 [Ogataea philodendri]KAH3663884.1 hypothetical protein OGAPHI_005287 [Ogataea philodendri]